MFERTSNNGLDDGGFAAESCLPGAPGAMASDPAKDDALILVDGLDRQTGEATKLQAHTQGLLHRAFSVVLMRDGQDGPEFLIAKRAACKYHSAGLWANSCCSHPRAGEELLEAAYRRVHEELGCDAVGLRELAAFIYRADFGDGVCEHEYDHVFLGRCGGKPSPDSGEASDVRWVGADQLADELARQQGEYAVWAPVVLSMALSSVR